MGVLKKGKSWYIDYYVQGRRKREKIGPSKAQARVVLQKRKVEIAEEKFLDIQRHQKVKFEEMARSYVETYAKYNKRSWWRDEISLKHLFTKAVEWGKTDKNPAKKVKLLREEKERDLESQVVGG